MKLLCGRFVRSTGLVSVVAIAISFAFSSGCYEAPRGDTDKRKATTSSLDDDGFESFSSVQKPIPAMPAAIDIQPANGTVFDRRERVSDLEVTFTGFSDKAGQSIEVQVLSNANAPITEANWVTIATTQTATAPTTFNDPDPIFRWTVNAVPAPSANRDRWKQGGLLRYRAIAIAIAADAAAGGNSKKSALPFFDASSGRCVAALGAKSWKEVLAKCKSPFSPDLGGPTSGQVRAAALVSPTPEPGESNRFPYYLSRKGEIEDFDTDDYYDFVDAPQSLEEFEDRFGFSSHDLGTPQTPQDVGALYYNLADLGIGREMHCTTFRNFDGEGTACYVRNYGVFNGDVLDPDFSGDPGSALADAVEGIDSFATVAMVKFGKTFTPKAEANDVQFFVYNAQDQIANLAQLDSVRSNESIPNNCLNCHGGTYDRRRGELIGASFLPFDPEGFLFSRRRGFTYEDQEEQFRQLNVLVRNSGAPPATVQFVDGIYGGKADVPGTKANLDWIPKGWSSDEESKTVYREVYKPFCRTCHVSQTGEFAFMRIEDFKKQNAKTTESVCKTNEMPVAEATLGLFWRSPARAYLVNSLGLSTGCAPQ